MSEQQLAGLMCLGDQADQLLVTLTHRDDLRAGDNKPQLMPAPNLDHGQ